MQLFITGSMTFIVTNCTEFMETPQTFSADGDAPRVVANGYRLTTAQCKQACVSRHASRYCAAANHNSATGACVLSGYRLHRNHRNVHYRRICTSGTYVRSMNNVSHISTQYPYRSDRSFNKYINYLLLILIVVYICFRATVF